VDRGNDVCGINMLEKIHVHKKNSGKQQAEKQAYYAREAAAY